MVLDADGLFGEGGADEDATGGVRDVATAGHFAEYGIGEVLDGRNFPRPRSRTGLITAERRPILQRFVRPLGVVASVTELCSVIT